MKVAIMQPYFFPYIGYWQLINAVNKFVIYDDVNFIKGGWINRNKILMNNEAKMINLRMYGSSANKYINEIGVSEDKVYNKKILKTLESCYKKAPYFSDVFPIVENIITHNERKLAKYLEYSIRQICNYLLINTELIISSSINKNNNLNAQDKILEICELLKVDNYYNSIGGQELYSYEDFASQGIKLRFLKTGMIKYKQFNNEFIPNLSIIDVMMFNSVEDLKNMLDDYEIL